MAAFAQSDDLADRWRPLVGDETERANTLLADASVWLRAWFPDLDGQVADGRIDPTIPVMVSCAMVKRAMLASAFDGMSSVNDSAGIYGQQRVFSNPQGNLYITSAERDLIAGVSGRTAVSRMSPGL